MTTSLDEARRYLRLAADDLAAFRALAGLTHIRQALAYFHAQQSIEKCLKAVLFVQGIEFRKTHDLYELADKLENAGIKLPISADALAQINPYAVEFRYGDEITPTVSSGEVESIATCMLTWAEANSEGP
jgi:HEPN domain-containing protein